MTSRVAVWICVASCLLATRALAGDAEVPTRPFTERIKPVGGWSPYGGGLVRWWPRDCFPRCGAPDDYCRKTLPKVCWPPYPCYFTYGPPEVCYPCCPQACPACSAAAR
jgi:hypothetical protein